MTDLFYSITKAMAASFVGAVMLASCLSPGTDPGNFATIGGRGWGYGDTLTFAPNYVEADSGEQPAVEHFNDLALTVVHTNSYEWANLWLEVKYRDADTVRADTFDVTLADHLGRWLGHGTGVTYQRADTLHLRHTPLADSDIKVRHIMRLDTLRNIEQIGITRISSKSR
jgi:gliding motility-associated lipoprotein GldH